MSELLIHAGGYRGLPHSVSFPVDTAAVLIGLICGGQ